MGYYGLFFYFFLKRSVKKIFFVEFARHCNWLSFFQTQCIVGGHIFFTDHIRFTRVFFVFVFWLDIIFKGYIFYSSIFFCCEIDEIQTAYYISRSLFREIPWIPKFNFCEDVMSFLAKLLDFLRSIQTIIVSPFWKEWQFLAISVFFMGF